MRLLTYRELRNEPDSDARRMAGGVSRTGGGKFSKALLHSSFLIAALLLLAVPAVALPEGRMITVSHDTTICWADSDGCFNYILQSDQLLKATGLKLRAGGTYFHTPFDVTKEPDGDALLRQLLMQERRSFGALLTWDNILHLTSSLRCRVWRCESLIPLIAIWFVGLWLYQRLWHRRRIRD